MKRKLSIMASDHPDTNFGGRSNKFESGNMKNVAECFNWVSRWNEPYWFIIDADELVIYVSHIELKDKAINSAKVNWNVDIDDVRVGLNGKGEGTAEIVYTC